MTNATYKITLLVIDVCKHRLAMYCGDVSLKEYVDINLLDNDRLQRRSSERVEAIKDNIPDLSKEFPDTLLNLRRQDVDENVEMGKVITFWYDSYFLV